MILLKIPSVSRKKNIPGYIYVIKKYKVDVFKFGLSSDPEGRMKTLQTGNETPLIIAVGYVVWNMMEAENRVKKALASCSRKYMFPEFPNFQTEWCDCPNGLQEVHNTITNVLTLSYLLAQSPIVAENFNEI